MEYTDHGFATRVIHIGSEPDEFTGSIVPAIHLATTYKQHDIGQLGGVNDKNSHGQGYDYSRSGNPTRGAFERCLATSEKGKYGLGFSSGLAATNAVLNLLSSGDEVVCIDDVYGGTQRLFRKVIQPTSNMKFHFFDLCSDNLDQFDKLKALISDPNSKVKMIWIESPTNPTLKIVDIQQLCESVRSVTPNKDIIITVDNTFMSQYFQNPLTLGADIVVHSITKYIGGHSDCLMGGAITSSDSLHDRLRFLQNATGAVPGPLECYNALRGMKTLHVRMREAAGNAIKLASFLESHAMVDRVLYPGLKSHPQHAIAVKQCSGFGAMITFFVKGGISSARAFLTNLKVFTLAESLGAVESLAESPALMTHASVPAEQREKLGIDDSLIRLSVGIEDVDDLLADVEAALEASRLVKQ